MDRIVVHNLLLGTVQTRDRTIEEQAEIDTERLAQADPLPEDTKTTSEDLERLILSKGLFTLEELNAIKKTRGV